MGYQALLFCPDEKTARTVTQVLSELDFSVVGCTEPFAAVKKLMAEHFDAVVVDCDNEQNATLLFKSARNAPNNQSALAVAVVEGQVGVAKAFRIGANLVLTKPINVEQAKGTLRVARGLLRKNEGAKPATPETPKPAASARPAKPLQAVPSRPPAPVVRPAAASIPAPKPGPQKAFVASAYSEIAEVAESKASANAALKQVPAPSFVPSKAQTSLPKTTPAPVSAEPTREIPIARPEVAAPPRTGFSVVTSTGSASAPAPAREATPSVPSTGKTPAPIPEVHTPVEEVAAEAGNLPVEESAAHASEFTFGGAVESGTKPASGGKKALIAIVAIILIAAAGYFAWTQLGPPKEPASAPAAVTPHPAPSTPPTSVASSVASVPSSATPSASSPATPQPDATIKALPAVSTAPAAKSGQTHQAKAKSDANNSESANDNDDVTVNKSPAAAVGAKPIVIKKGHAQSDTVASNDAPALAIGAIAPAGNGGSLPNLMNGSSSAPTPVLQTMNVSQGVSQGLVIKKVAPSYPTNALRMRIEGPVQLLATISKKGDISAIKILSGDPGLARAASEAVKQWKYKPYLLDGSPVEIQT
ncbi:MAG: TonB family protein, partial [Candidatus Sulfotelmatobacter sp.]